VDGDSRFWIIPAKAKVLHMLARSKAVASLPQLIWWNANFGVSPISDTSLRFRQWASISDASPVDRRLSQQFTPKQIQQLELRDF
jgi:hypothetical protein